MASVTGAVPQLGPDDAGVRLTAEEFARADYDPPFTYERMKGRLVVMSPAGHEHRQVSRPIRRELGLYWGLHRKLVDDVDMEGWVATSPDDDRVPDICVYLTGKSSTQHAPDRVPDLVFEFVSANRADQERDDIDKRAEYAGIGVREYVIVDRFKRAVLVLIWAADDFSERWLSEKDTYTSDLLPGLEVPIGEVFA